MKEFDVTIAGEINLDLILYGLPAVMGLERELLASRFCPTLGSSSAIVAHNLGMLGARVGFITRAGSDEFGKIALARLAASGADLSHVVFDEGAASTGITVLLVHDTERHILTYPGTMSEMKAEDLDIRYLKNARHFHLSSLFLQRSLAPGLPKLFRELKDAGLTISLDTNDDPEDRWGGVLDELLEFVDVLLPSETEACHIAKENSIERAMDILTQRVPLVVVKCGPKGSIIQRGTERFRTPAVAVTPIDTIGAGDSFDAGFLFAWLRGLPLQECARAGNIAGALSTLRSGGTEAFRDRELTAEFLMEQRFPAK